MREILTLQFGQYANFVGTHFWNTQEAYFSYGDSSVPEFDHDVLFREGKTQSGVDTYTPRLLIYDMKGGFGSIPKVSELYGATEDEDNDIMTWEGNVESHINSGAPAAEYSSANKIDKTLNDADIKSWSDFNRMYYHPRTVNEISQISYQSELNKFDCYNNGIDIFQEFERESESIDTSFRQFAEECDYLQCINVMASVSDGFGGFTASYLEYLKDDYPKTPVMTFSIADKNSTVKQKLNSILSFGHLSELSSVIVPMVPPQLDQNVPLNPYQTSSILSMAIETATLPLRLKGPSQQIADLIGLLQAESSSNVALLSSILALSSPKQINLAGLEIQDNSSLFGQVSVHRGLQLLSSEELVDWNALFPTKDMAYFPSLSVKTPAPLLNTVPSALRNAMKSYPKWKFGVGELAPAPHIVQWCNTFQTHAVVEDYASFLDKVSLRSMPEYQSGTYGYTDDDFAELKETIYNKRDAYSQQ